MDEIQPSESYQEKISLSEKLDNYKNFLDKITPEKAIEIMTRLKEKNQWENYWEESYWISCALPLLRDQQDILDKTGKAGGNVVLAPGFRRCGKTTSMQMMKALCETFTTPKTPLPKVDFIDGQGIMLRDYCQDATNPQPNELEKVIIDLTTLKLDCSPVLDKNFEVEGKTRTHLENLEVVLIDELCSLTKNKTHPGNEQAIVQQKGEIILKLLEAVHNLCPNAIILTTTGHSLKDGPIVEDIHTALYEANQARNDMKLKIVERGLPDAWDIKTVMDDLLGIEANSEIGINLQEIDLETAQAWLLIRLFWFSYSLGNPFIIDNFFKSAYLYERQGYESPEVFEKAMRAVIRTTSEEKSPQKPFALSQNDFRQIVREHQGLQTSLEELNVQAQDLYARGVNDVYTPEALMAKLQKSTLVNAQALTRLFQSLVEKSKPKRGKVTGKGLIELAVEEFSHVNYSTRAKGASRKYPDIVI